MAASFNPFTLQFEDLPDLDLSAKLQHDIMTWVPESLLLSCALRGMTSAQLRRFMKVQPTYKRLSKIGSLAPHYRVSDVLAAVSRKT